MDMIFLSEVSVKTRLGVPEWERLKPQTILLDLEIDYDFAKACESDAIADTIDYGAVVGRIRETLEDNSFQLVEALAAHVCQLVISEFGATRVKIKVAKPNILPGLKALGVVIERKA